MTVLLKNKVGLKLPAAIQEQAGIGPGDLVEITAAKGRITIRPVADESRYPVYKPTRAEAAAIRRGRAAFKRRDYISLKQLHEELGTADSRTREKRARKAS